jgi:hypothetical protein
MAYETLQAIVGTALVDSTFRRGLLDKSPDALSRFELTPEESAAIESIKARTFQGFAKELHGWISRNDMAAMRGVSY